ncbi:uncharacterized protein LOC126773952 [Nymphalis io]|uniref:uncharacterized protein LOC126773952 n=1 Tax=Inachis io TaxID=171585 RepID=UPI002166FF78|nr:uncharacterized protein LOC126773952 [Nymphalis io]
MARHSFKVTMDGQKDIEFLFDISKEIKHFYETPVIFLTQQDYSDSIFNAMCSMRSALQGGSKTEIIDIIVDFHIHWIYTIKDLEQFSKRILNDLTREEVYQAVSFTIDAMSNRLKYYQKYILKYRPSLSNENQANLLTDLEIVEEMHKEVTRHLLSKLKCLRSFDSNDEFKIKVRDSLEELYQWIDRITDGLAYQLTKYIKVTHPEDLTKVLQQIVEDLKTSKSSSVQTMLDNIKEKALSTMIRSIAVHNLEISIVLEKINSLEDHISKLQSEPTSPALMALQHKKDYLETTLASLENLKTTLEKLAETTDFEFEDLDYDKICPCEDFYQLRIFNHALPPEERERLVTELCYVWDIAVFGERSHKSIISILSAADIKEEFNDDLGTYFIDEHSRKIYKLPDDETLYQPNEHSILVPLKDDEQHIYFYDECGRYYIDQKTRQRIYKAHETASEYMMDSSGILLKIKEEWEGVTYYYDNYGRYYINSDGKHIYREVDSVSEYENDGLGNLVRIRSSLDILKPCPDDVPVSEDFKYLKTAVGKALRECIADVILHQPDDPIKYLSARLIKYRENMELKEKRAREKGELDVEREIRITEERAAEERAAMEAAMHVDGGSEASYDSNLIKYSPMHPDDIISAGASSFI